MPKGAIASAILLFTFCVLFCAGVLFEAQCVFSVVCFQFLLSSSLDTRHIFVLSVKRGGFSSFSFDFWFFQSWIDSISGLDFHWSYTVTL